MSNTVAALKLSRLTVRTTWEQRLSTAEATSRYHCHVLCSQGPRQRAEHDRVLQSLCGNRSCFWEELQEMEWTVPHEKGNPGHRVLTSEGLVNVPPWESVQGHISFPSGVLVEPLGTPSSAGGVTLPRSSPPPRCWISFSPPPAGKLEAEVCLRSLELHRETDGMIRCWRALSSGRRRTDRLQHTLRGRCHTLSSGGNLESAITWTKSMFCCSFQAICFMIMTAHFPPQPRDSVSHWNVGLRLNERKQIKTVIRDRIRFPL